MLLMRIYSGLTETGNAMKKIIIPLILLVLAGCEATPVMKQPAMKIDASELSRYWQPVSEVYQFEVDDNLPAKGYVEAKYLIDSEGKVYMVTLISSTDPHWGEVVEEMLAQYRYTPAEHNTKRIPVWVSNEFTLSK